MRSLLDTHVFLWFITGDDRLSVNARRVIEDPQSDILLSVVSVWEMAIKAGLGRLPLPLPLCRLIPREMARNSIQLLPLALDHALEAGGLPHHHRDPFDRMLVVQSRMEEMPIISADPALDQYGIVRLW